MANILVTGGAGYIGSHACKLLRAAGHNPVVYDNLSTGWADAVRYGVLEQGDLLDRSRLDEVFRAHQPSCILHFAARSQVGESIEKPELYWQNNFLGSIHLIEAAIAADCRNIVFSSTCATYGEQDKVLLDEHVTQRPTNAYGAGKWAIEKLLDAKAKASNINYLSFRYFNVAGADPAGEVGEFHDPETHLIPIALQVAAGQRSKLVLYGTDYDTPDGTCVRDYIHVMDLVDAHLKGVEWLLDGKPSGVFNLGTGVGYSVKQVIDRVRAVTGQDVPYEIAPRREGDCAMLVSGGDRAKRELGWNAKCSELDQMIADAWKWQLSGRYEQ